MASKLGLWRDPWQRNDDKEWRDTLVRKNLKRALDTPVAF
jgi:hypothetical protein